MPPHLSFSLDPEFLATWDDVQPPWGFPMGGDNTLGEITYLRTYSRLDEHGDFAPAGMKERWVHSCARVTAGTFSILKDHCVAHRTPWDENRAQRSAQEFFIRMFSMKWLPPGRGIWMMGSRFVAAEGSAALQNCAFISTDGLRSDPQKPFTRLMEMLMLGIGVGFDTAGSHDDLEVLTPGAPKTFIVPDSREGWCEAVGRLIQSYTTPGSPRWHFDLGLIRPKGAPIKRFGGTAAGPEPLRILLARLERLLDGYASTGSTIDSRLITDIGNSIGACVKAGNVRSSAEIALGDVDDKDFINLKRYDLPENAAREEWGWVSNNTVRTTTGVKLDHLAESISWNGEPGIYWLDLAQDYGRLADPADGKDHRATGCNPCAEQTLESYECCTLVETFPTNHETTTDYHRTLKFAYLYAKAVTLLPTHWPETNEVMTRNRRIGTSMSGLAQAVESPRFGWSALRGLMDVGYQTIQAWDRTYSEWLGVRESIKTTSIKPSGTVSLLAGVTPGVHWPTRTNYLRRMRFRHDDPLVQECRAAGYHVEPADEDPDNSSVVSFPVLGPDVRSQDEVSLWEKAELAALAQAWWADNMVSATLTFTHDERNEVGRLLEAFTGRLKVISFLPPQDGDDGTYRQLPYEAIDVETYEHLAANIGTVDLSAIYRGNALDAEGESGCSTDVCEVRASRT